MQYRVRNVDFVGDREYPQGYGMTWDDIVIDVPDDEEIVHVSVFSRSNPDIPPERRAFDGLCPVVRLWLMKPVAA